MTKEKKQQLNVYCCANREVGYGHFYRCLELTKSIRTVRDIHVIWHGNFDERIESVIAKLPKNQVCQYSSLNNALTESFILVDEWVLIDSYQYDSAELASITLCNKVVVIDDFAPHYFENCLGVINFCLGAESYIYRSQYTFLGTDYFICRPELAEVRREKLSSRGASKSAFNVLVVMGGYDRYNLGISIADAISDIDAIKDIRLFGDYENKSEKIFCRPYAKDINEEYYRADIVICGGGLIKYESAFCGVPAIVVSQTPEQYEETIAFSNQRLCINGGCAESWQANLFKLFIKEKISYLKSPQAFYSASDRYFDSSSTLRLAKKLIDVWESS